MRTGRLDEIVIWIVCVLALGFILALGVVLMMDAYAGPAQVVETERITFRFSETGLGYVPDALPIDVTIRERTPTREEMLRYLADAGHPAAARVASLQSRTLYWPGSLEPTSGNRGEEIGYGTDLRVVAWQDGRKALSREVLSLASGHRLQVWGSGVLTYDELYVSEGIGCAVLFGFSRSMLDGARVDSFTVELMEE